MCIVTKLVNYVSNRNKNQSVDKINNKLNIINFNYGGTNIVDYNLTGSSSQKKQTIDNLLKGILNLFIGIKVLNNNGIVHRDIKPQNIVFDGNNLRIIDFGLSINYINNRDSFLEKFTTARYWPLDFNMCYFMKKSHIQIYDNKAVKVGKIMKIISKMQKMSEYNYNSVNDKSKITDDLVFLTVLLIKYHVKNKITKENFYNNLYSKFDLFSLGQVLDFIFNRPNNFKRYINVNIKKEINPLIRDLTMSSYNKRPDFDESINRYKRLLVNNSVITDKELKNIDETLAIYSD